MPKNAEDEAAAEKGFEDRPDPADTLAFARRHQDEIGRSDAETPSRFADFERAEGEIGMDDFLLPSALSGSDFSGGSAAVANYRRFIKDYGEHEGVYLITGAHSSYGIAIRLGRATRGMLDALGDLEDRPAAEGPGAADGDRSLPEDDFRAALARHLPEDDGDRIYGMSGGQLRALFETLRERGGVEWEEEPGGEPGIDIEAVAHEVRESDLPPDGDTIGKEGGRVAAAAENRRSKMAATGKQARLTPSQAYGIASQWGSYMTDGDPGAVFYTFPAGRATVQSEDHRKKLIAYTEDCLRIAPPEDKAELEQLLEYFKTAPVSGEGNPARASLGEFAKAYVEAALFASMDEAGDPLDDQYGADDISPETLARMKADCDKFEAENADLLNDENCLTRYGWEKQGGHDFWLTRNHHGAGFWEKSDWAEAAGRKLTESAHGFGEYNLYVGDDGLVHGE